MNTDEIIEIIHRERPQATLDEALTVLRACRACEQHIPLTEAVVVGAARVIGKTQIPARPTPLRPGEEVSIDYVALDGRTRVYGYDGERAVVVSANKPESIGIVVHDGTATPPYRTLLRRRIQHIERVGDVSLPHVDLGATA